LKLNESIDILYFIINLQFVRNRMRYKEKESEWISFLLISRSFLTSSYNKANTLFGQSSVSACHFVLAKKICSKVLLKDWWSDMIHDCYLVFKIATKRRSSQRDRIVLWVIRKGKNEFKMGCQRNWIPYSYVYYIFNI